MTEADFQAQVTGLAEVLGWSWVHFRAAQTASSWRTPVEGPLGAGWPDLVLARERVIYAELKGDRPGAVVAPVQREVLDALKAAGAEVYAWWPHHFEAIRRVLTRRHNEEGRPTTAALRIHDGGRHSA